MLFLIFQLGKDRYALPASRVVEVVPLLELKTWAQVPQGLAGVFNFRGSLLPAVDLCEFATGSPARRRLGTRIIVVRYPSSEGKERLVGVIAEQVTETLRRDPKEFQEQRAQTRPDKCAGPICMDGQRAIQWLDERRLLAEPVSRINRLLPTQYRDAGMDALPSQTVPGNSAKISTVLFRIQSEWLAFPAAAFQEIVEQRRVHSLPHRRESLVLGVTNVRGELLVCISLGRLLGIHSPEFCSKTPAAGQRMLVIGWGASRFAFSVDEVQGVYRLHPHELKEPPATVAKSREAFTQGVFLWANGTAGLLDAERVFTFLDQNLS